MTLPKDTDIFRWIIDQGLYIVLENDLSTEPVSLTDDDMREQFEKTIRGFVRSKQEFYIEIGSPDLYRFLKDNFSHLRRVHWNEL